MNPYISKKYQLSVKIVDIFYTISRGGNLKGAIFDKKLFGNTLSPHQSTDILSLDSNPGVPQSTLLETAFSTPSTKQAKLLFVPVYAYLSVFRSPHPFIGFKSRCPTINAFGNCLFNSLNKASKAPFCSNVRVSFGFPFASSPPS
jgi:hypothetical protein